MSRNGARDAVLATAFAVLCASLAGALPWLSGIAAASGSPAVFQLLPPRTGIWPVNITLYGDAADGWGFTDTTISQPGPNITVYRGDIVNLTLVPTDSLGNRHNWFIDYDDSLVPNGDEPSSPDFNVLGDVTIVYEFSADRPGNWTYYCRYHQGSMSGSIRVLNDPRPVNLTLVGDASRGWGFSSSDVGDPGPSLVVLWGTNVTLTLVASDTQHNWFIDYDDSLLPSDGEPSSPDFGPANDQVWSFIAARSGNWTYLCRYHQSTMTGSILVVGGPPVLPPSGLAIPLITGIMIGSLALVFVFAVVYHVRAVRAAKRHR